MRSGVLKKFRRRCCRCCRRKIELLGAKFYFNINFFFKVAGLKEHQILHRMVKTRGLRKFWHFEFAKVMGISSLKKVPPKPGHRSAWDVGVPPKAGVRGRKRRKNKSKSFKVFKKTCNDGEWLETWSGCNFKAVFRVLRV